MEGDVKRFVAILFLGPNWTVALSSLGNERDNVFENCAIGCLRNLRGDCSIIPI